MAAAGTAYWHGPRRASRPQDTCPHIDMMTRMPRKLAICVILGFMTKDELNGEVFSGVCAKADAPHAPNLIWRRPTPR